MNGNFQFRPGSATRRNLPNRVMIATCAVLTVKKLPRIAQSTTTAKKVNRLKPSVAIVFLVFRFGRPLVAGGARRFNRQRDAAPQRGQGRDLTGQTEHLMTLFDGFCWYFDACGCIVRRMNMQFDHTDFSVVVKNRAPAPKPWKWEIYRAGRNSPIEASP